MRRAPTSSATQRSVVFATPRWLLALALSAAACGGPGEGSAPTDGPCRVRVPPALELGRTVIGNESIRTIHVERESGPEGCFEVAPLRGDVEVFRVAAVRSDAVDVVFAPTTVTVYRATLGTGDTSVRLNGVGALPTIRSMPTSIDFGAQAIGCEPSPEVVTLTNSASVPIALSPPSLRDADAPFVVALPEGTTIPPSGTLPVEVTFVPRDVPEATTLLDFEHVDGYGLGIDVLLRGGGFPGPKVEDEFRQAPRGSEPVVEFALSRHALPSSVRVFVDGAAVYPVSVAGVVHWTLTGANAVRFTMDAIPDYDASVVIEYQIPACL